jgi:hypothetical protein
MKDALNVIYLKFNVLNVKTNKIKIFLIHVIAIKDTFITYLPKTVNVNSYKKKKN